MSASDHVCTRVKHIVGDDDNIDSNIGSIAFRSLSIYLYISHLR